MEKKVEYKYKELSSYFYKRLTEFSLDAKNLNGETLNYIIDEVIKERLNKNKNDDYNNTLFEEGLFLKFIFVRNEINNRIRKVVSTFSIVDKNLSVSQEIIKSIASTCLQNYSFTGIVSGDKDKEIQELYFSNLFAIEKTICTILREYVDNNIGFEVDYDKLQHQIVNDVLFRGVISLNDIVVMSDKARHYIKLCAFNSALKSVKSPVVDIEEMLKNSIGNGDRVDEVRYDVKKTKMLAAIKQMMDSITLYGFSKGMPYIDRNKEDDLVDRAYANANRILDGDRYKRVFSKDHKDLINNVMNVINDYNKYKEYGDAYKYLGFYEAYQHIRLSNDEMCDMQDKLLIMDQLLFHVKNQDNGIATNYDCFIEIVFDSLVAMGCYEVNDVRYKNAVEAYKIAKEDPYSVYPKPIWLSTDLQDLMPLDVLSYKTNTIDCIMDMMKLYEKYSAGYYGDLSTKVNDTTRRNNGRS